RRGSLWIARNRLTRRAVRAPSHSLPMQIALSSTFRCSTLIVVVNTRPTKRGLGARRIEFTCWAGRKERKKQNRFVPYCDGDEEEGHALVRGIPAAINRRCVHTWKSSVAAEREALQPCPSFVRNRLIS